LKSKGWRFLGDERAIKPWKSCRDAGWKKDWIDYSCFAKPGVMWSMILNEGQEQVRLLQYKSCWLQKMIKLDMICF
jgi:hypothetical protein